MRIIAGEFRGRRLAGPPGQGTRPMLDRVREALFGTLGELAVDASVLDLFAGTGSLGLEALSRGARRARFVERHAPTLATLRANVAALGLEAHSELARADALAPSAWTAADGAPPDLVFFDPPYPLWREPASRRRLAAALAELVEGALAPGGTLVLHAPRRELDSADFRPAWRAERRDYGSTALWYLSAPSPGERA